MRMDYRNQGLAFFGSSFCMFALMSSVLFADDGLVCDGKLERKSSTEGIYYAPVNFSSLRVIPKSDCGPEKLCEYSLLIYSGGNKFVSLDSFKVDSLCNAVASHVDLKKIVDSGDDTESEPSSPIVIPKYYMVLQGFNFEQITFTEFNFEHKSSKYRYIAVLTEYLIDDVKGSIGIWEGDQGGGEYWQNYVKKEEVMTAKEVL